MKAEEKAKELVEKFRFKKMKYLETDIEPTITVTLLSLEEGKRAALIAVDEILKALTNVIGVTLNEQYWQEVKQEIEKL